MIATIRAFFLSRLLREKVLILALVVIVVALWLSSAAGRAGRFVAETQSTSVTLAQQSKWLANKDAVEKAAQKAANRFDPTQTLDGTRLLAAVSAIARDAGLRNYSTGSSEDLSTGQFAVHTLQFTVVRGSLVSPEGVLRGAPAALALHRDRAVLGRGGRPGKLQCGRAQRLDEGFVGRGRAARTLGGAVRFLKRALIREIE